MQSPIVVVLLCLVAMAVAYTHHEYPAVDSLQPNNDLEAIYDTPAHDRSHRNKRGLLLLKKKLLLGALGLKVAKAGVVGAGVAGALALKKKKPHGPSWNVEVHRWH